MPVPFQPVSGLLCYCRPGFEPDLAAELAERAAGVHVAGYPQTNRNDGYVLFHSDNGPSLTHELPFRELVFARQKLMLLAELRELDPKDRIAPIFAALAGRGRHGELLVEHPDSDDGKQLAGLARSFGNALRPALRKRGFLSQKDDPRFPRLHVFFVSGTHAFLAQSTVGDSAPWPLGIPRLRVHADAPSRSALKLEEAFLVLLTERERKARLQPGMRAADLGAAPGGWTWVLTRQHMRVVAVDNGPLQAALHDTGLVDHQREDGFRWKPDGTLDWMVCDMVEQPRRVAERMATWFREGWCRNAIFNLKLPMKKRWQETLLALDLFAEQAGAHDTLTIRARQLYHDREEITVYASIE
ncbi:23S rRNA (cytidine(2498)-2'-O)-methyltransferase RlmM [Luteimonas sp. BDR2-5]|uniref:23S rRNA (cytidine(2498)-2'-O)-methyltransferase RlmM n=1 Tax=Proluteimonas luteida TaxID=2878685 RepID=UPI001E5CAD97|nr:23S rRNA (cytidine(2498)-2'-O)-methyltransferase RlmM [Luteimonas sp. BDR2-5]MCD9028921.1 23S rRNA (cytidine(2498)-2'-O)-methyltransferase RlmM [Luteimonas sp. BDR2-5]